MCRNSSICHWFRLMFIVHSLEAKPVIEMHMCRYNFWSEFIWNWFHFLNFVCIVSICRMQVQWLTACTDAIRKMDEIWSVRLGKSYTFIYCNWLVDFNIQYTRQYLRTENIVTGHRWICEYFLDQSFRYFTIRLTDWSTYVVQSIKYKTLSSCALY